MKGKKIFAGLVSVILVLSLTVACDPETQPTQSEKSSSESQEPARDLGGREIKVLITEGQIPLEDSELMKSFRQTGSINNCEFVFERNPDVIGVYEELIRNHLAGVAPYEATIMRGYNVVPGYASSGALLALSDYYDFENDEKWQDHNVRDFGWWKGKRYGLVNGAKSTGFAFWYNKALLREANIPDLWEYVENDTWNWETFRDVIRRLTIDKNNDGTIDQYGFASEDAFLNFIVTNGGNLIEIVDGKATYALNSENSVEAIQFVTDLYVVDGSIPPNDIIQEFAQSSFHMMPTGALAIFPYHVWYGPWLQEAGMNPEDIGWVYPPKGPRMDEYAISAATEPSMYIVPSQVENPEDVVYVLQDALAIWSPTREVQVTFEEMHEITADDDRMLDIMMDPNIRRLHMEGGEYTVYTYQHNYGLSGDLSSLWQSLILQESTPQAATDAVKDMFQIIIDEASQN